MCLSNHILSSPQNWPDLDVSIFLVQLKDERILCVDLSDKRQMSFEHISSERESGTWLVEEILRKAIKKAIYWRFRRYSFESEDDIFPIWKVSYFIPFIPVQEWKNDVGMRKRVISTSKGREWRWMGGFSFQSFRHHSFIPGTFMQEKVIPPSFL